MGSFIQDFILDMTSHRTPAGCGVMLISGAVHFHPHFIKKISPTTSLPHPSSRRAPKISRHTIVLMTRSLRSMFESEFFEFFGFKRMMRLSQQLPNGNQLNPLYNLNNCSVYIASSSRKYVMQLLLAS